MFGEGAKIKKPVGAPVKAGIVENEARLGWRAGPMHVLYQFAEKIEQRQQSHEPMPVEMLKKKFTFLQEREGDTGQLA